MLSEEEIANRLGYHRPTSEGPQPNTVAMHRELRQAGMDYLKFLDELLPDGRAKSVALTEFEDAQMWAHKAIAQLDPVDFEGAPFPKVKGEVKREANTPEGWPRDNVEVHERSKFMAVPETDDLATGTN